MREFGGAEGLKELVPLLADSEPLVQREAVQGLMLNGSKEAAVILLNALTNAKGPARDTLLGEVLKMRDQRAAPLYSYLVRQMDRGRFPQLYLTAIEALGSYGGADAIEALTVALHTGHWWTIFANRKYRWRRGARAAENRYRRRHGRPARSVRQRRARARSAARAELAGAA